MNSTLNTLQNDILKRWQKNKPTQISDEVKETLAVKFTGDVLYNEPLSKHTWIKIGGPAQVLLKPDSIDSALLAIKTANSKGLPLTFLGAGANTLVKDKGVAGFVLSLYPALNGIKLLNTTDTHYEIEAYAGTPFSTLLKFFKSLPATGFEELAGIPGSVGGTLKMNAGVAGLEIQNLVKSAFILTKDGECVELSKSKIGFSYRHTQITKTQLVVKVIYELPRAQNEEEMQARFQKAQETRAEKQPLQWPSLGSVFKNPEPHKNSPKVYAGQLIEEAGLKGVRVGGARISEKHGNFIINENNASAKDVLALIDLIKNKVKTLFGYDLETEIKIIGEDDL